MKDTKIVRTDNIPLIDELVYNIKILVLSCVLKDEDKALKNETVESARESAYYISAVQDRMQFDLLPYDEKTLESIGLPQSMMNKCLKSRKNIPDLYRGALVRYVTNYWINNYEEKNNYYRMLNGKPNLNEEGIYIDESYTDLATVDFNKPIHEQDSDTLDYLNFLGVIDQLKEEYPKCKYLNYLGSKSISIIDARLATKFSLLYVDNSVNDIVYNKFINKFELNRDFTLKTIYSEAYKFGSEYYDNFIMVLITVQTMIDMFAEVPDYIIKGELFDLRTIQMIFESYGVDFYSDIPFIYQSSMLRNINRLIKYKSTTKNIVDICSLFGFDNIYVFKYYILKIRNKDENGNYVFAYDKDGKEDLNKEYDLKFLKVPVDDIADNYLNDSSKYLDYDVVTHGDQYWDGEMDHNYIKNLIIDHEYNYVRSKYLSIDTVYSMTDLSFQICYFYNIIFNDDRFEEYLNVSVPYIDTRKTFKLLDIFCYLFALGYESNGIKDKIIDTQGKILSIRGFNFKVNMNVLRDYVQEKGFTLEELGVADFQIPKDQVLSYKQLIYIYTKNKQIYDHVVDQMIHANNYKIYKIYEQIYQAFFIMELNTEVFRMSNGEIAKTYTEFIQDRDGVLYESLMDIKNIKNKDSKVEKINNTVSMTTYALQEYLSSDDLKYIFNILPTVSAEAIKHFIAEVVNFFKSFKMELMSINTIYKFDDRLQNKIKMIDDVILKYVYTWQSVMDYYDKLKYNVHLTREERIEIKEKMYTEITYWVDHLFDCVIFEKDDKINGMKINTQYLDKVNIHDALGNMYENSIKVIVERVERLLDIKEKMKYGVHFNYKENIFIKDQIYMEVVYWINKIFSENIELKEELKSNIHFNIKEDLDIVDRVKLLIRGE